MRREQSFDSFLDLRSVLEHSHQLQLILLHVLNLCLSPRSQLRRPFLLSCGLLLLLIEQTEFLALKALIDGLVYLLSEQLPGFLVGLL